MLRAALFACALILALPASASAAIPLRCDRMVRELNLYRDPDVRIREILCDIARERSKQQAAGHVGHNVAYVARRLTNAGVRWCNVGEAIGWTTARYYYASDYARRFIALWRSSPNHWPMLSGTRYDSAGGQFERAGDGRTYATLIVMDAC